MGTSSGVMAAAAAALAVVTILSAMITFQFAVSVRGHVREGQRVARWLGDDKDAANACGDACNRAGRRKKEDREVATLEELELKMEDTDLLTELPDARRRPRKESWKDAGAPLPGLVGALLNADDHDHDADADADGPPHLGMVVAYVGLKP